MALRQARGYFTHIPKVIGATGSRVSLAYDLHNPRESDILNKVPIIFMHGFLGSKRENRGVSKLLSNALSRQIFAVDLRNHGDSGHHPKHDYMEMALDVASFMKSQGFERATLIGHSMGAKTALTLALHEPDLVSEVIAIDNGPIHLPLTEDFPRYLRGMAKVRDAKVKSYREAETILKNYEESPSVRLFLLSNFINDSDSPYLKLRLPLEILEKALGPLGDFPHKGQSLEFHRPALFLRALQSHYIPESAFPLISSFFHRSRIVNINSGHWIVQDQPEQFHRAVVEFLQAKT